nr:hypothetical protein [uncultured Niameybacter sp.]
MSKMKKVFGGILLIGGVLIVGCSSPSHVEEIQELESSPTYTEPSDESTKSDINSESSSNLSEEAIAVKEVAEKFAQAYFTRDMDGVMLYVDKGTRAEVYGENVWDHMSVFNLKWDPEKIASNETVNLQFEFKIKEDMDSYDYLDIVLSKTEEGWKINSYGIEK